MPLANSRQLLLLRPSEGGGGPPEGRPSGGVPRGRRSRRERARPTTDGGSSSGSSSGTFWRNGDDAGSDATDDGRAGDDLVVASAADDTPRSSRSVTVRRPSSAPVKLRKSHGHWSLSVSVVCAVRHTHKLRTCRCARARTCVCTESFTCVYVNLFRLRFVCGLRRVRVPVSLANVHAGVRLALCLLTRILYILFRACTHHISAAYRRVYTSCFYYYTERPGPARPGPARPGPARPIDLVRSVQWVGSRGRRVCRLVARRQHLSSGGTLGCRNQCITSQRTDGASTMSL